MSGPKLVATSPTLLHQAMIIHLADKDSKSSSRVKAVEYVAQNREPYTPFILKYKEKKHNQ